MAAKKFAWSWSALTGYETCPHQHYRLKIKKDIFEAPSSAMLEGQAAHTALEKRVRDGTPLPGQYAQHEGLCAKFRNSNAPVEVEQKLGLTADLEPTEFFAKDVWLRAVLDVNVMQGARANVYDYKTGKRKPDSEQLMLFAGVVFAAFQQIETVDTFFLWLKTKEVDKARFERHEHEALIWQTFEPRVADMAEAYEKEYFPCRPSGLCRGWCPVRDCKHWEPKP